MTSVNYPLFKKEDIDGFFALFQNNLANFALIAVTMLSIGYPAEIVYGRVIPGAAVAVFVGNIYYARVANRLAQKEGRTDVTALAYGISTPVMFVDLFGVTQPALELTNDPEIAWRIGVAACFLGGAISALGSIIGKWLRKNLPRAAMLGALSGVALFFIAGELFFNTYEMPVAGMVSLAIILVGMISKKPMPFRIPSSVFAIVIGVVLAYSIGGAEVEEFRDGLLFFGFYPFLPSTAFLEGFSYLLGPMSQVITAILPISIYNFIETMNNVEAMESAGDSYNVREALLTDGTGTMIGAVFGGIFPTTVYIASVGAKWVNAGQGYSILNGLVFLLASITGLIAVLSEVIPVPVIAPVLVFVGISMVSQTFSSIKPSHFTAATIALFPILADFLLSNFEGLSEVSPAIEVIGEGAMFTAVIWGSIVAQIVDNDFVKAAIFSGVATILSAVGFMHAPELTLLPEFQITTGYLIMAFLFVGFHYYYANFDKNNTLSEFTKNK